MKFTMLMIACSIALSASTLFAQAQPSAHDPAGHNHAVPGLANAEPVAIAGPHGGSIKQAGNLQFETLVSLGGLKLFVYDRAGQPVSVDRGRGVVSIRVEGNAKRYRYDLLPDGNGALTAPVNLSQVAGRQIEVGVKLVGIAAADGTAVSFNEVATVPASEQQIAAAARPQITVTTATASDAPAIARQKVCPVMDEPLGSMGGPIKVMIGDKPIYLCCKGCIKKIQAEPAKYLAVVYGTDNANTATAPAVPAGTEQVREGVFKVTADDAPFVAAQKKCPVMDEPLDAMGGPYKVHAAGKAIYICCPGCAKKVTAEPQKYLTVLAEQGVDAPVIR